MPPRLRHMCLMATIECIPNVSEGRRSDVVAALVDTIRGTPGARLLDYSSDPDHNRSVMTFVGEAAPLKTAVLALFERAVREIDLRIHVGQHPRIGAVDVVPFVPLAGATMQDCVALARDIAGAVASRYAVPVYLYEEASTTATRKNLEDIRRGGFEGLASKMQLAAWSPDFGPPTPHPTAGATVIGARGPLIAYNVNLDTDRLDIARRIAAKVRHSSGGFPFVKAVGVRLERRGIVQVSMNLTNYRETPMATVFEAIRQEAARSGVAVSDSEIVGLVPDAALTAAAAHYLQLKRFTPRQVLEARLAEAD